MTTAAVLVNDALEFLNISSGIMPADPDQQSRCFKVLQRLFHMLPTKNIYLQMRKPATISANLQEPQYATEHLAIILAYHSAVYFQAEMGGMAIELYAEALNELRRKTGKKVRTSYPSTLPLGSGMRSNLGSAANYSHYYAGSNEYKYTLYDERKVGEAKIYLMDFSDEADSRSTAVASVVWSNIGNEDAVISGETLTVNTAEALLIFGTNAGGVIVKARATFDNGEIYDGIIQIDLIDPEGTSCSGDSNA